MQDFDPSTPYKTTEIQFRALSCCMQNVHTDYQPSSFPIHMVSNDTRPAALEQTVSASKIYFVRPRLRLKPRIKLRPRLEVELGFRPRPRRTLGLEIKLESLFFSIYSVILGILRHYLLAKA